MFLRQDSSQHLISVHGIITPSQLRNILEQTKQRLLDLLLDLKEKFPTFDDNFSPTKENLERARNIINYNIYGGTNSSNLAVADKVTQANTTNISIEQFSEALKKSGVPGDEIPAIKDIVQAAEPKESRLTKAMRWIGQLSKKMVEKGIELNLPQIIEAIQRQIEQFG